MTLADLTRRFLGGEPSELAGAGVAGEIPVTGAVANRLIAQRLEGSQLPVTAVQFEPHDGNEFTIRLSLRVRLVPAVTIAARIEQQPTFPHDPVLTLRWTLPGLGPLAMIVSPIIASFALPPGIRIQGDRVTIDVREVLQARGLGEVADYIEGLQVHTREGAFLARFSLRV
jgi:hypothetical protein